MRVRPSRTTALICGHCWPETEVKLARACARRAADAASVGLPASAFCARVLSVGSPKLSHHGPFGASSFGWATRNGSSTLHAVGISGLGGSYFGGVMQPGISAAREDQTRVLSWGWRRTLR